MRLLPKRDFFELSHSLDPSLPFALSQQLTAAQRVRSLASLNSAPESCISVLKWMLASEARLSEKSEVIQV